MSSSTDADIKALRADLAQLREDFAQVLTRLKHLTVNSGDKLGDAGSAAAAEITDEIKARVSGIAKEIENKPLSSALAAFAGGVLIGALLRGSR